MKPRPPFKNYDLTCLKDKNGVVPKVGDWIRFTLYDGIENVVTQITVDEYGYFKPYTLNFLEFKIFDGQMNEDDTLLDDFFN